MSRRAKEPGAARLPVLLAGVALAAILPAIGVAQPVLGGCRIFPSNNVWNRMVDELPVDLHSDEYMASIGRGKPINLDPTVPINVVGPEVPAQQLLKLQWPAESDPGPVPIPENARVEQNGDAHMLILQTGACRLYELYAAKKEGDGWSALNAAFFDLNSNRLRPEGWTSADAAGLPVLPGLLRYDEVKSGQIAHAVRTTVPHTQRAYIWPARHIASKNESRSLPPMGLRLRLKRNFDTSGFSPEARVVLLALQKYGALVADNGGAFQFTATPDGWPIALIEELKRVTSDSFEAVDTSDMVMSPNSGRAGPDRAFSHTRVPYSASMTLQLDEATLFSIILEGDGTLALSNIAEPGKLVTFQICQDVKGGHRLNWPVNVHAAMAVGQEAGKCSVQSFVAAEDGLYATGAGVVNQ